jgi:hypothetical protein
MTDLTVPVFAQLNIVVADMAAAHPDGNGVGS